MTEPPSQSGTHTEDESRSFQITGDREGVDEATLISAFSQSRVGLVITELYEDEAERVVRMNAALEVMLGYSQAELAARFDTLLGLEQLRDGKDGKREVRRGADSEATELPLVCRDGREMWVAIHVESIRDAAGRVTNRVIRLEDIGGWRGDEQELRYFANHDALTGLLNRRRFAEEVQRAIHNADRFGDEGGILFLDLDHFKHVNDAYGHSTGDRYLMQFADMLRGRVRSTDVMSRLSGDEFAVLLPRTAHEDVLEVAEAIRAATPGLSVEAPSGDPVELTVSIGIAHIHPGADANAADILVEADLAMYEAKQAGRNGIRSYVAGGNQREHMAARLAWATQIRSALEHDSFVLFAQPIIRAGDRAPVWYELLLRMPDASGNLLLPSAFLYAAGRFGLEAQIDLWVFERTVEYLRRMPDQEVGLAVNITRGLLADPCNAQVILDRLVETGVDPRRILFEIVETTFVDTTTNAARFMGTLQEAGCRFALDDFGAGYSSFHHLKRITVDLVKIDGEFVRHAVDDDQDRLFVEKMTELAHGLGIEVIAESVRDAATAALMSDLGVDYLQGFETREPGPVAEVVDLAPVDSSA